MKRTLYVLGGIAALLVLAIFVWTILNDSAADDAPPAVADVATPIANEGNDVEDTAGSGAQEPSDTGDGAVPGTETGELPPLPRMDAVQGSGPAKGLGGGGGLAPASAVTTEGEAIAESATMIAPDFSQIFAEVSYVLNATLPTEPTSAIVQQRVFDQVELADARLIADQFGFTGPLYTEVFDFLPTPLPAVEVLPETTTEEGSSSAARPPKESPIEFELPKTYHAFDGSRILNIYAENITYINREVLVEYGEVVADAIPIAEAFLQERGMLNFPYVMEQGFTDGEVMVYRLVEGLRLPDSEIFVQVSGNGEIAMASNHKSFSELAMLGTYPLISAESAWQLVLDGVVENNISFRVMPGVESTPRPVDVESRDIGPRFWHREYQPGTDANLYAWPVVYERADGEGPPRVEAERFVLTGSDADLQAIADQRGQMFHFWGQMGADGSTFTLSGWETLPEPVPLHMEGDIQRSADQVLFVSSTGETFIIPQAPVDLPDGLRVGVFAWDRRDVGLAHPILDWQNIDEWFDYDEEVVVQILPEPAIVDEDFIDPFNFTEITINEVKLGYQVIFDFENFDQRTRPPEYVQPVWQFSGITDNGDSIDLSVQAVAPEYLQSP